MRWLLTWIFIPMSLLFALRAFAERPQSEFFHQAQNQSSEVTIGIGQAPENMDWTNGDPAGVFFLTGNFRNSNKKTKFDVVPFSVATEYGVNRALAVGIEFIYASGTVDYINCPLCTSIQLNGLFNPVLYLKGRSPIRSGVIVYGAVLDLGVERQNTDSSGNSNLATGGSTFSPYIGYQVNVGGGFWGARFQYDLWKGNRNWHDESTTPVTDNKLKGGVTWSLDTFYEAELGKASLGASLFYESAGENMDSTNGADYVSFHDALTAFGGQVYVPVRFTGWTLLPSLSYYNLAYTQSQSTFTSSYVTQIGAVLRVSF